MPNEAFDDLEIITTDDQDDDDQDDRCLEQTTTIDQEVVVQSSSVNDNHNHHHNQHYNTDNTMDICTALYMSSLPICQAALTWNLASFLMNNLIKDNYQSFFPIQSVVIPNVVATERPSHLRVCDVCVAAPTGSGKTLDYVVPILNALANCCTPRL